MQHSDRRLPSGYRGHTRNDPASLVRRWYSYGMGQKSGYDGNSDEPGNYRVFYNWCLPGGKKDAGWVRGGIHRLSATRINAFSVQMGDTKVNRNWDQTLIRGYSSSLFKLPASLCELRPDKATGQDGPTRKWLSEVNAAITWIKKSDVFGLLFGIKRCLLNDYQGILIKHNPKKNTIKPG